MRLIVNWKAMPAKFVVKRPMGYGITYKTLGGYKQPQKRDKKAVRI